MASSPQEKFDAAVKVIQSLPKEGPFQPSHEMMLMFYAYFKQATEGPCHITKPNFWEIVKKAKWDAWNKLGNMDREVAMLNYVEELKKIIKINNEKWKEMEKNQDPRIVEAMPQTNDVGKFMETLGSFYEIVDEDSPIQKVAIPNNTAGRGSTGNTPELSHSDTSSEQDKEDELNFSLRVEKTLQQGFHDDEADAIPDYPDMGTRISESGEIIQLERLVNGDEEDEETEEEETEEDDDTERVVSNSESEEEFCDTSEINPTQEEEKAVVEKMSKIPNIQVQMSTPLKRETKQNHVRFAEPTSSVHNGRVSPIVDESVMTEFLHMPSGSQLIQNKLKLNGPLSDSLVVQTSGSFDTTAQSLLEQSQLEAIDTDYSANNSNVFNIDGGGEEDEPPGGRDGKDRRGQGQKSKGGQSGRSSQSSGRGVPSQGGSGRRALLTGGGAGGDGEDNPPQAQGPSSQPSDPINDQIAFILVRLQQDMTSVLDRLNRLEQQNRQRENNQRRTSLWESWFPFSSRTGRTAFFVLVWPVIVHLVLSYLFRRRRRR